MDTNDDTAANTPLSPFPDAPAGENVTGYCFSCRTKKTMHNAAMMRLANNRWAFTGTCETCGKKMYKISAGAPVINPNNS